MTPEYKLIRRRLFWLLFKLFGAVILITMVLALGLLTIALSGPRNDDARFPPAQLAVLETYYRARGSWEGIEVLWRDPPDDNLAEWSRFILVDPQDRVIAGSADGLEVGAVYADVTNRISFPVVADGVAIGRFVYTSRFVSPPFLLRLGALPLLVIGLITTVVMLAVGYVLGRRIVNPLAAVISAAEQVQGGDLNARATISGSEDFRTLADSFNQMVETLQLNEQQRRHLLADIAHELRTPLTILRGRLEGILDGIYTADEAHIAPALIQTHLLEKLVDDLRLLTLAETGQLSLERQPIDLGAIAASTATLFEAEALERDVTLALQLAPNLPLVNADPQRMRQVIGNLLSNALRHVPDGGRVTVAVQQASAGVALAVADSGSGVPPADLPHLFDRFWRAEKSRSRTAGGAGLGLAIVKQLVERQGGTISAENQPNSGLRVTVTIY